MCLRNEVGPFYEDLLKIGQLGQLEPRSGGMVAVVAVGQQQGEEPLGQSI